MKEYFFKILFEIGSASKEKTQFSDHLRSGLKVQNLLLIAKRSNIIAHIWKKTILTCINFTFKAENSHFWPNLVSVKVPKNWYVNPSVFLPYFLNPYEVLSNIPSFIEKLVWDKTFMFK